jgi:tetratricopeptide (TPR) repeat protein
VDRLLTPLLRRVYAAAAFVVLAYTGSLIYQHSAFHKEQLYRQLVRGDPSAQASAAFDLVYLDGETQLLRALKSSSATARVFATTSLWDLWARAAGTQAFHQMQVANQAIQHRAYSNALEILTRLTRRFPEFPEGWNRRATLYWQMGRFEDSIDDARKVVALNPNHFGAWQGMGLCQMHLGNLEEACRCMREALRINPHDPNLQRFLRRCEELLRLLNPNASGPYDTV